MNGAEIKMDSTLERFLVAAEKDESNRRVIFAKKPPWCNVRAVV
jgi:hypothetical protein